MLNENNKRGVVGCVIVGFLFLLLCSVGPLKISKDYKMEVPPEYNKGTFWKSVEVQLTDYSGKEIAVKSPIHKSCYIDGDTIYNGIPVYETTFIVHEEGKISKLMIRKSNLGIQDALIVKGNSQDTLNIRFELLNFPLFEGKKWESLCSFQESKNVPASELNVSFEVFSVKDSTIFIKGRKIETTAFHIEAEGGEGKKSLLSNYTYLAPAGEFPGTSPIFMWNQFYKNSKRLRNGEIVQRSHNLYDYNW